MLAITGCSAPTLSQTPDEIPSKPAEQVTVSTNPLVITLTSPETLSDDRRAAVVQLLETNQFASLGEVIESAGHPVLAAIFQSIFEIRSDLPESLIVPTINHIQSRGADASPAAVRALAGVRTKPAITPIVGLFQAENAPQSLIDQALSTLLEQTGREDLGRDSAAWTAWWEEARWLPPREWEAMQAAAHAERARRLQRESDQQFARILELHRRMYSLTPQDQRSALLATMMGDDEQAVRLLAFELAELALLNTQRLDDQVRIASVDRLSDGDPAVRAAAASLLFRLGAGDDAVETVRRALRRESNPDAAASMLIFLGRRPNESDQMLCLNWLDGPEPAATAAAGTLFSSAIGGILSRPKERSEALATLRAMDSSRLTPGKIALFGILGDSTDRQRLTELLGPEAGQTIRRAASIALVRWPSSTVSIAKAMNYDSALLPILTDALIRHEATLEGYHHLADLSSDLAQEIRGPQLLRLRRAMPPGAVLDSIGPSESLIEAIGSVLFETGAPELADRDPRYILTQALIAVRYDSGDDSGVLDLLDQIEASRFEMLSDGVILMGRRSLISLGRFDEAVQLGADQTDWKAAFDRSQEVGAIETGDAILSRMNALFPTGAANPSPNDARTTNEGSGKEQKPVSGPSGDIEGLRNEAVTLEPSVGEPSDFDG